MSPVAAILFAGLVSAVIGFIVGLVMGMKDAKDMRDCAFVAGFRLGHEWTEAAFKLLRGSDGGLDRVELALTRGEHQFSVAVRDNLNGILPLHPSPNAVELVDINNGQKFVKMTEDPNAERSDPNDFAIPHSKTGRRDRHPEQQ